VSKRGGGRRRRFARARKAYDEMSINDQGRPRQVPDPNIDISFGRYDVRSQGARNVTPQEEPLDDVDWLDEKERRRDQT
jgi:hypothetical protein